MKPPSGQGIRLACLLSLASLCLPTPLWEDRDSLMQEEEARLTGGNLVLSTQEQQLSMKLISLKKKEVAAALNTGQFPPSMHFFRAKSLIEQSAVFSILKRMPKGRLGLNDCSSYSSSSCLLLSVPELGKSVGCSRALTADGLPRAGNSAGWAVGGVLPLSWERGERKRWLDCMNAHFQQL